MSSAWRAVRAVLSKGELTAVWAHRLFTISITNGAIHCLVMLFHSGSMLGALSLPRLHVWIRTQTYTRHQQLSAYQTCGSEQLAVAGNTAAGASQPLQHGQAAVESALAHLRQLPQLGGTQHCNMRPATYMLCGCILLTVSVHPGCMGCRPGSCQPEPIISSITITQS